MMSKLLVAFGLGGAMAAPLYHTVDQDHFDGSNPTTWGQRYYVNDTFWTPGSDAPVFLCVGGEGPAFDRSVVSHSVHCNNVVEWLPETKALLFAVQHRYYGCHNASAGHTDCPVEDVHAEGALRFLSSRQALGDLVAFHEFATTKYGLTAKNKWVSWGGSYPGMLAGWFRLKFPNLVHAAVASSAPVQARVDMRGYNDVLAQAFGVQDNGVGGSPACRANIAAGHAAIAIMWASETGRASLASLFNLPSAAWLQDPANQMDFAGNGVAVFDAQDNNPACPDPACNIAKICVLMEADTFDSGVDVNVLRLASVRAAQAGSSSTLLLHKLRERKELSALRRGVQVRAAQPQYWAYQTCTEFAFFQTCEVGSQCFYVQGLVTLENSFYNYCKTLWNISPASIQHNVDFTNAYTGGWNPKGSRVVYVNGEVDPWHSLSVNNSTNPNIPSIWVPGASHHTWTHPSAPTDQKSVVQARGEIRALVSAWLKE